MVSWIAWNRPWSHPMISAWASTRSWSEPSATSGVRAESSSYSPVGRLARSSVQIRSWTRWRCSTMPGSGVLRRASASVSPVPDQIGPAPIPSAAQTGASRRPPSPRVRIELLHDPAPQVGGGLCSTLQAHDPLEPTLELGPLEARAALGQVRGDLGGRPRIGLAVQVPLELLQHVLTRGLGQGLASA